MTPRLVLGDSQQGPPSLAQRRLGSARLGEAEHVAMAPGAQGGIDAHLLGVEAELLQPAGLDPAGLPAVELAERATPPQRQGLTADVGGALVLAEHEQFVAAPNKTLEAASIDVVSREGQPVPLR